MTTVHQVFSIRSFKSAKDRDFIKALRIYDANTHPQSKTDSREIALWLHKGAQRSDGKFYVCGLYISGTLVGYVEFIYLKKERLIHFDYFIIDPERRSAGAFHIFAEQMREFFLEENLEWDFITAEISHLDPVDGVSKPAQRLIRLFRQVGFYVGESGARVAEPQILNLIGWIADAGVKIRDSDQIGGAASAAGNGVAGASATFTGSEGTGIATGTFVAGVGGASGVARDFASIASTSARAVPYFSLEPVMTSCRRVVAAISSIVSGRGMVRLKSKSLRSTRQMACPASKFRKSFASKKAKPSANFLASSSPTRNTMRV